MIKSKKQMFIVIGSFLLVMLLGTVTYAFFNYTRTGAANTLQVGRIAFISRQTNTISLSNLFPIDPTITGIMDDATKVGTLEIEVEGDTDYSEGVEYLISSTNTNIYTSTGKTIPISISMTVDSLGTSSANYFTARENTNESIYKRLVGDTIVGDQMLLVGFIKSNSTPGTASGVDGSITIKAYLDKNKIVVSDTLENGPVEVAGYTNLTDDEWVAGRTVLTTAEWNSLQGVGVSFKVRVEANEGIWVNGSLEEIMRKNNIGIDTENGVDFSKTSDQDNTLGVYMRAGTENDAYPIMYYRGAVEDNNVKFANKCWKAVRTTDTGGVKLIYNGEYTEQNKCNNTGTATQITLNISGTDTNTFSFSTDSGAYGSPAYNGYMYGDVYAYNNAYTTGAIYGKNVEWDGTNYLVIEDTANVASTNTTKDDNHHYSCGIGGTTSCTSVKYYYYKDYHVTLTGGDGIEQAMTKMRTNTTDSNAKDKVETWYASNMTGYTNKIEDSIYCNDRNMATQTNGWVANGGSLTGYLYYAPYGRAYTTYDPSLSCPNKNDAFTWKNGNGNQKLEYPVGMITSDEIMLAGGKGEISSTFYLTTGSYYWTLSPNRSSSFGASEFYVSADGTLVNNFVNNTRGLRPSISLKPGMLVVSGTGTVLDPYVIE